MSFDGLIFDLDGTLWDSTTACAEGWNRALQILGTGGRRVTADEISKLMGLPHPEVFEKAFPDVDTATRKKIADLCFSEEMSAIRRSGSPLYPGAAEGLKVLAARYPLFLVSNCYTAYLELFFGVSGLRSFFKDAECMGGTGRPKAENIALVMSRNSLKNPAYIGDTAGDQRAAGRAGASYFHVDYGFGYTETPCPSFRDFSELVAFFTSLG